MVIVESSNETEISLVEFLSRRARHSSDARLALDAGLGLLVAVAAAVWQGPAWYAITPAGLCFVAYGAWGIVDRELQERLAAGSAVTGLQVARVAAAVVGLGAAISFGLAAMAVLYGRFIS